MMQDPRDRKEEGQDDDAIIVDGGKNEEHELSNGSVGEAAGANDTDVAASTSETILAASPMVQLSQHDGSNDAEEARKLQLSEFSVLSDRNGKGVQGKSGHDPSSKTWCLKRKGPPVVLNQNSFSYFKMTMSDMCYYQEEEKREAAGRGGEVDAVFDEAAVVTVYYCIFATHQTDAKMCEKLLPHGFFDFQKLQPSFRKKQPFRGLVQDKRLTFVLGFLEEAQEGFVAPKPLLRAAGSGAAKAASPHSFPSSSGYPADDGALVNESNRDSSCSQRSSDG
jgi:hypothetical protein